MGSSRKFPHRNESEVAVLEALIDRQEGLTVFELRSHADIDIDELEVALCNLKEADLIAVKENGDRTVILPDESVIEDRYTGTERSLIKRIRDRIIGLV